MGGPIQPAQPSRKGSLSMIALYVLAALCLYVVTWTAGAINPLNGMPSRHQTTMQNNNNNPLSEEQLAAEASRNAHPLNFPVILPSTTKKLPKIALMFLTRGDMPLEPLWRWWLGTKAGPAWRTFFSIYVHPAPGYIYPNHSMFAPFALPEKDRIKIEWGQHSMVDAERNLLRAALKNPLNQYFLFIADDTIPLYRPAVFYTQLMTERKSRINSCVNSSDGKDVERTQQHRWQKEMAGPGLTVDLWRKDSQWTSFIRKHAQLVAYEKELDAVFSKECWSEGLDHVKFVRRFCVSDEHYFPSLLALKRLENECQCDGVATHVFWEGNYYHPKTYSAEESTVEVFKSKIRGEDCQNAAVDFEPHASHLLKKIAKEWKPGQDVGKLVIQEMMPMPAKCPLFARKIDRSAGELYAATLAANSFKKRRRRQQ